MGAVGDDSSYSKGEEFFDYMKLKSLKTSYSNLYDYIISATNELSQDQSFYTLNLADILWKIQVWKEKLPDVTPFYAVKANADPILIRLFVLLGFSFDCSTKGEIDLVLESGGNPKNIIYAHTVKPPSSLEYAAKVGVDLMTFDTKEELLKIKRFFPNARLVLRIKYDNPNCSYDLSIKYGCSTNESEELLQLAKKLDLNVIGLSFHVGALCDDSTCYSHAIYNCHLIFELGKKLGFKFELLDLGGGFFGSRGKEELFDSITVEIRRALKQYFSNNNIRIIAEPGCYFVGSSQQNITCVIGSIEKNTHREEDGTNCIKRDYFVNDGIYGSFFRQYELYDVTFKPLLTKVELEERPTYKSKIWGQTCCCEDVILEECLLPKMQYGEYLVWENMGAYTLSLCSTFTGVPIPIARYIFIKNPRLHLNWIENTDEIEDFITKNAILIEDENFP